MTAQVDLEAVVGIHSTEPIGDIEHIDGGFIVGSLVQSDAGVEVVPRHDIAAEQHQHLMAAASAVWLHGRSGISGSWRHYAGLGWCIDVWLRDRPHSTLNAAAFALSMWVRTCRTVQLTTEGAQ